MMSTEDLPRGKLEYQALPIRGSFELPNFKLAGVADVVHPGPVGDLGGYSGFAIGARGGIEECAGGRGLLPLWLGGSAKWFGSLAMWPRRLIEWLGSLAVRLRSLALAIGLPVARVPPEIRGGLARHRRGATKVANCVAPYSCRATGLCQGPSDHRVREMSRKSLSIVNGLAVERDWRSTSDDRRGAAQSLLAFEWMICYNKGGMWAMAKLWTRPTSFFVWQTSRCSTRHAPICSLYKQSKSTRRTWRKSWSCGTKNRPI